MKSRQIQRDFHNNQMQNTYSALQHNIRL